ncbi:MAG: hypothetical protein KTR30_05145 [Saprospiraceae bacterium]|nr:hypothetical protein [Saprospiraceae bacterium]
MTLPTKVPAHSLQGGQGFAFQSFLEAHALPTQSFVVNPSRRTTVVGKLGTRLTFFPNSFIDSAGQVVTDAVTLKLREAFSKDEMIFTGLPTTSEDRLLESAGQFQLQASTEAGELSLCKSVNVELPIREEVNNPVAMRLFRGSSSSTRAYRSGFNFDWELASDQHLNLVKNIGKRYFNFSIDHLNWWNCDCFVKARQKVMLSVKMQTVIEAFEDRLAFLVFRDINAVVRMYPTGRRFSAINIPTQLTATLLVMTSAKGQLYLGEADILRTSNRMLRLPIQPIAEHDLIRKIRQVAKGT